jgi:histidinol-phosphate phosphatase family protein
MKWEIDETWTLFLDRDGVINARNWNGYIERPADFHFLTGVPEAISFFTTKFKYIFVVTNQQGIGKKIMTESNLLEVHRYMTNQLEVVGAMLTKVYFAPALKEENSILRKPQPGMALQAQEEYKDVNFEKSIMIGDTDSDILFGKNLGMKTIRVKSAEKNTVQADLEIDGLIDLIEIWK